MMTCRMDLSSRFLFSPGEADLYVIADVVELFKPRMLPLETAKKCVRSSFDLPRAVNSVGHGWPLYVSLICFTSSHDRIVLSCLHV